MNFKLWIEEREQERAQALQKWALSFNRENARLHMSHSPNLRPHNQGQWISPKLTRMTGKPSGLWYAIGIEWVELVLAEHPQGIKDYIFEIEVNPAKLLIIKSQQDIISLEDKYGDNLKKSVAWGGYDSIVRNTHYKQTGVGGEKQRPFMPDWQQISRNYDGIELDPDKVSARWADEWRVNSGCIWRNRSITNVRLLASYNSQYNEYK